MNQAFHRKPNGKRDWAAAGMPARAEGDLYRTPGSVTKALLAIERFAGPVHEPACGDGAISEVLKAAGHRVFSSDLFDRGYGISGWDFLAAEGRAVSGDEVCETLITNPPFRLADEFALHALALGYKHIALFARLAWLEGARRHTKLWDHHRPARIWVFSKRQTLWRGDEEGKTTGGTLAFAWFVWQAGHSGTQIGWLS